VNIPMRGGSPMAAYTEDWVRIAQQVSVEMDPTKLMALVEQLCNALDGRRQAISRVVSVSHKGND
jgi:hypothetical protein